MTESAKHSTDSASQPAANRQTICILGGGSFGTVLANIAAENGHRVYQWMRSQEQVDNMTEQRENTRYLPGCPLHPGLIPTTDLPAAINASSLIMVAIPSRYFRQVVHRAVPYLKPEHMLVSTTKGIEADTFKLMSEVLREEAPDCPVGVISGPNLAKELAARQLTATVVASDNEQLCAAVQSAFHCDYFRVYAGSDTYGVELGGALKNIYAIAAGMSAALAMGENTRSMLMTRSLAEMSRFAVKLGADPMTFLGLAGVGDLIVTCMSPLSRNYRVGYALGQGRDLQQTVKEIGEVAEGVNTIRYVKAKADELGVYMPLVDALYAVVFGQYEVREVIKKLMMSEQGDDVEFVVLDKNTMTPPASEAPVK